MLTCSFQRDVSPGNLSKQAIFVQSFSNSAVMTFNIEHAHLRSVDSKMFCVFSVGKLSIEFTMMFTGKRGSCLNVFPM